MELAAEPVAESVFDATTNSPPANEPETLRGFVDHLDASTIDGWAAHPEGEDSEVEVELLLDGLPVARCLTHHPREDVAQFAANASRAGFEFEAGDIAQLRALSRFMPEAVVSVQVARADTPLRGSVGSPTLATIFPTPDQTCSPPQAVGELLARLSQDRATALDLARQPVRPQSGGSVGFIELAMIDRDYVWVVGWLRKGTATSLPVVIVDRQKIAAGLSFTYFDRADCGPDAAGFLGVISGAWTPNIATQAHLYFGDALRSHLETLTPFNVVTPAEFAAVAAGHLRQSFGGHPAALQQLLASPDSWATVGAATGFTAEAAVDHILVVPKFGALASGWVLCGSKTITGLALRVGSTILTCDDATSYRTARDDLAAQTGDKPLLKETAGFVAAFRGSLAHDAAGEPLLKVIYDDGTSSNHSVSSNIISRLGHASGLDSALSLFPSLEYERFFPDFAAALRDDVSARAQAWTPHRLAACGAALVVALPPTTSNLFLVFAELTRMAQESPDTVGFVFLSERIDTRPLVVTLFGQFSRGCGRPCSLIFVQDIRYAAYQLGSHLITTRTNKFCYVDSTIILTPSGWKASMSLLGSTGDDLTLLGVDDPAIDKGVSRFSFKCFAWTRRAFADWIKDQPFMIGGFASAAAPVSVATAKTGPIKAACLLASAAPSPIIEALDRWSKEP